MEKLLDRFRDKGGKIRRQGQVTFKVYYEYSLVIMGIKVLRCRLPVHLNTRAVIVSGGAFVNRRGGKGTVKILFYLVRRKVYSTSSYVRVIREKTWERVKCFVSLIV